MSRVTGRYLMKPVTHHIKEIFGEAVSAAFPKLVYQDEISILPAQPKFGDFQCNNALRLFQQYGSDLGCQTPECVAKQIEKFLPENDLIGSVVVAKAGFITIKLKSSWIEQELVKGLKAGGLGYSVKKKLKIAVDFSSPNIAKEMHVGHLRSTIIGEATCRILEFCGHSVERINHVGDWGTQFGMLIRYMKEAYPDFQNKMPDISDLQGFYKKSKRRFDEDPEFKKESQLQVVALQSGEEFAVQAWKLICEVSRRSFQVIYDRLDVTVEERGESFYNELVAPIVKELQERKMMVESKGAQCFFTNVPNVEYPLMIVKNDGGLGYDSTDLAAIYHRLMVVRADWCIYITDIGQETHFWMIFDAAKQAGWHREGVTRCDHMGFGVVTGEDGKKFKTRSGTVVRLNDLLDEAESRARVEIEKRWNEQEKQGEKNEVSVDEASRRIGMAAVKYFDLKQNRVSNYAFSFDKMLDNKGDTAVYLFYQYARICSMLQKSGVDISELNADVELKIVSQQERDLAIAILKFSDKIELMLSDLHIHRLCEYVSEITKLFSLFYNSCKVIGSKEQNSRLLLCEMTRLILKQGFTLLGFEPLERI